MSTFVKIILLSIYLIASSSVTHASLITNGSFEQTTFVDYSTSVGSVFNTDIHAYEHKIRAWDVFYSLPSWETTYGNGIELQKNIVTRSQGNSVMTQTR